jgi:hypothetical protein
LYQNTDVDTAFALVNVKNVSTLPSSLLYFIVIISDFIFYNVFCPQQTWVLFPHGEEFSSKGVSKRSTGPKTAVFSSSFPSKNVFFLPPVYANVYFSHIFLPLV